MKTKKIIAFFIVVIALLGVCLTFTACNKNKTTKYSVSFIGGEGSTGTAPAEIVAKPGDTITLPENAFAKDGYHFGGWSDGKTVYSAGAAYTVPSENTVLTATWIKDDIENVTVSFYTDGGNSLPPVAVAKGQGLEASDTPVAQKTGYVFVEWYLDKNLTQKFNGLEKVFLENTTLYASYRELPVAEVNVFLQEEAALPSCPSDTTLLIAGDGTVSLNAANLGDYLTVTANDGQSVPSLTVSEEQVENITVYRLTPETVWTPRTGYILEIEKPFRFVVTSEVGLDDESDEITISASKLELLIAGENVTSAPVTRDGIISVAPTDYLLFTEEVLYLKPESLGALNIAPALGDVAASILKIEKTDGSVAYARVASMQNESVAGNSAVAVRLAPCEPDEVYEELEVYEQRDVTAAEILEAADIKEITGSIASDPNLLAFMQLSTFAVADYVTENDLATVCAVSFTAPKIDVSLKASGDKSVTAKFKTSFRVFIDAKNYADVSIDVEQAFRFAISTKGDVLSSNWHFDVGNEIVSRTKLKFSVVLNLSDESYDIKQYIGRFMGEPDADSFVARYKKTIGMDTDEITLLSVPLFEMKFKLASIFEVSLPVSFKVKLNLNAAFSSDIDYTISKVYGIKGEKGKGVTAYKKDSWTSYSYDLYYSGYIGLKAGINFAMELGFAGLSDLGKAGVSVEVGAYFDFYGHGNRKFYSNSKDPGEKPTGAYYFETGVYVQMEVYVKSEIFFAESSATLFEVKIPQLEAGDKQLAVAYADDVDDEVNFYGNEVSYRTFDIYRMEFMSLETGYTKVYEADPDLFLFSFDNNAFFYDRDKQTVGVRQSYLNSSKYDGGRLFAKMEVRYIGPNSCTSSQVLTKYFDVSYVPRSLNIAPEDLDKQIDVKFNINGVTYATLKTRIGSVPIPPVVSSEWYASNPAVAYVDWRGVVEPVTEAVTFEAKVEYQRVKVNFLFRKDSSGLKIATWQQYTLWCHVYDDPKEVVKELSVVPQDFNEYYVMTGWSENINSPVPMPSEKGGVAAVYEMTYALSPFTVTLDVATLENRSGVQILGRQLLYDEILPGEIPEFDIKTLPGYHIGYDVNGMWYSEIPEIYGPTVIRAELTTAEYYSVRVYRYDGIALEWDYNKYSYGDDASEIMTRENVTSYAPQGFTVNGVEYVVDEVNWFPDASALTYITGDVEVYPVHYFSRLSYRYVFDAGEGSLPVNMSGYEDGIKVVKGEKLSADVVEKLTPTKASDENYDYVFDAWNISENGALRPVEPAEYVSVANVTFVASYTAVPRTYKTTLYSNGKAYTYTEGSDQVTETPITAHFGVDDGATTDDAGRELIEYNLSSQGQQEMHENLKNLINCPQPVPENSAYEFAFWILYSFESFTEAQPVFRLKDVQVSVVFEMGKGEWMGNKGTFVSSTDVPADGREVVCYISNFFIPEATTKANIWDGANGYDEINCSYIEDGCAYTAVGWSKTPDGAIISQDDAENELRLSTQSGDVTLYAVYNTMPLARVVNFYISSATESFADGEGGGIRTIVRDHGSSLPLVAPAVSKRSEDSYYVYEFLGWKAESTQTMGLPDTLEKNESYTAVFEKRLKEVTLTFDAGTYGVFPSTNSNTLDVKVLAGSIIYFDDVEKPVFVSDSKYYNIYFNSWGYKGYFQTSGFDTKLTARVSRVRNQVTTDTPVGITVSNGVLSEDIGQNSIEGYVYDPDNKTLSVNGAGLTFDGGGRAFDLDVQILASDITLKNITINGTVSAGAYPNAAGRPANAFTLNVEGNVTVSTSIAASDEYCTSAIKLFGLVAEIVGKGSGASLTVNYTAAEYTGEGERVTTDCNIIYANSLIVSNLTLNVVAEAPDTHGVNALKITRLPAEYSMGLGEILPKLNLVKTTYNVTFTGGEPRNAVGIDEGGEYIKDEFSEVVCIGG